MEVGVFGRAAEVPKGCPAPNLSRGASLEQLIPEASKDGEGEDARVRQIQGANWTLARTRTRPAMKMTMRPVPEVLRPFLFTVSRSKPCQLRGKMRASMASTCSTASEGGELRAYSAALMTWSPKEAARYPLIFPSNVSWWKPAKRILSSTVQSSHWLVVLLEGWVAASCLRMSEV